MRPTFEIKSLDELADLNSKPDVAEKPVRFAFVRSIPVKEIRAALAPKGKLRLSATSARIYADLDPGPPEPPLVALDTIVRSDAKGLERMIWSVLPHVDEIVLGIDGRSDKETIEIAELYADQAFLFGGSDIGLSIKEWEENRIHFANARNLGRSRVKSPWTLVLDSDEYLEQSADFRALARKQNNRYSAYFITAELSGFKHRDSQRFALTSARWESEMHNQLIHEKGGAEISDECTAVIVQDLSLRPQEEVQRRRDQRNASLEDLRKRAADGDLVALFHMAKHVAIAGDVEEAIKLSERYRSFADVKGPMHEERTWLALALAYRLYSDDDLARSAQWCCRALLDGPCVAAMCILGDVAESRGNLKEAHQWYKAACAIDENERLAWPGITELRFNRLGGIENALIDPEKASKITLVMGDEEGLGSVPAGERTEDTTVDVTAASTSSS